MLVDFLGVRSLALHPSLTRKEVPCEPIPTQRPLAAHGVSPFALTADVEALEGNVDLTRRSENKF